LKIRRTLKGFQDHKKIHIVRTEQRCGGYFSSLGKKKKKDLYSEDGGLDLLVSEEVK
jgi:hypothetical protein